MSDDVQLQYSVLQASRLGDLETLQSIDSTPSHFDVNFVDEGGLSPLMHAVVGSAETVGKHAQCIEFLIARGATLDHADATDGRTALHWAVASERADTVALLVANGADPTTLDYRGQNPVHLAVSSAVDGGGVACLEVLAGSLHVDFLRLPDGEGLSPIARAIEGGSVDACRILLSAGFDPSATATDGDASGWTAFHWAAYFERPDVLAVLLKSSLDAVSVVDVDGKTAAHVAAVGKSAECVATLVKACGVKVMEAGDRLGVTPLMYACGAGNEAHVKKMLKKRVGASVVDLDGRNCLHWCKDNSNPKCIQTISKYCPSLVNEVDNVGQSPLHHAAMTGNGVAAEAMVSIPGANLDVVENDKRTALHWATVGCHVDIVYCLAEGGANLSTPDVNGAYPLHYTAQLCGGENDDISTRALECLTILLEKGADPDVRDPEGRTPLMWAANTAGTMEACRVLVSFNADVNAKDAIGMTALHTAVNGGQFELCVTLVSDLLADVNACDEAQRSPLFYAVSHNFVDLVEFLLQAKANPDLLDQDQMSVAHVASSFGHLNCLQIIQSHMGRLDLKNSSEAVPLHEAAGNGHIDCVDFLLIVGCSSDPRDSDGVTPLHFAAAGNFADVCRALLSAGADVNAVVVTPDDDSLTSLDYAEECRAFDAVSVLKAAGGKRGQVKRKQYLKEKLKLGRKTPAVKEEEPDAAAVVTEEEKPEVIPEEIKKGDVIETKEEDIDGRKEAIDEVDEAVKDPSPPENENAQKEEAVERPSTSECVENEDTLKEERDERKNEILTEQQSMTTAEVKITEPALTETADSTELTEPPVATVEETVLVDNDKDEEREGQKDATNDDEPEKVIDHPHEPEVPEPEVTNTDKVVVISTHELTQTGPETADEEKIDDDLLKRQTSSSSKPPMIIIEETYDRPQESDLEEEEEERKADSPAKPLPKKDVSPKKQRRWNFESSFESPTSARRFSLSTRKDKGKTRISSAVYACGTAAGLGCIAVGLAMRREVGRQVNEVIPQAIPLVDEEKEAGLLVSNETGVSDKESQDEDIPSLIPINDEAKDDEDKGEEANTLKNKRDDALTSPGIETSLAPAVEVQALEIDEAVEVKEKEESSGTQESFVPGLESEKSELPSPVDSAENDRGTKIEAEQPSADVEEKEPGEPRAPEDVSSERTKNEQRVVEPEKETSKTDEVVKPEPEPEPEPEPKQYHRPIVVYPVPESVAKEENVVADKLPSPSLTSVSSSSSYPVSEKSLTSLIDTVVHKMEPAVTREENARAAALKEKEEREMLRKKREAYLSAQEAELLAKLRAQRERPTSAAVRAMKELAKAHALQLKMKRAVERARMEQECNEKARISALSEERESAATMKGLQKCEERLAKVLQKSKTVSCSIDVTAESSINENDKMGEALAGVGGHKRPTVSQWLESKSIQKQKGARDELMHWDTTRLKRDTVIAVEKKLSEARVGRHQAWEKSKQLQNKIHLLKKKQEELISPASFIFPERPMRNPYVYDSFSQKLPEIVPSTRSSLRQSQERSSRMKIIPPRKAELVNQRRTGADRRRAKRSSLDEPLLFTRKVERDRVSPAKDVRYGSEELWDLGEKIVKGKLRSTTYDAPCSTRQKKYKSLEFVPGETYRTINQMADKHSASPSQELLMTN